MSCGHCGNPVEMCVCGPRGSTSNATPRYEATKPESDAIAAEAVLPQPAPVPNGNPALWDLVIEDMRQRDNFGRAKYGTPLQTGNGRDFAVDLLQELLDAAVYAKGLSIEFAQLRADLSAAKAAAAKIGQQLVDQETQSQRAVQTWRNNQQLMEQRIRELIAEVVELHARIQRAEKTP